MQMSDPRKIVAFLIIFPIPKTKKTQNESMRAGARIGAGTDRQIWQNSMRGVLAKVKSKCDRCPLLAIWITNWLFVSRLFRGWEGNKRTHTHTSCPQGTDSLYAILLLSRRQAWLGMGRNDVTGMRSPCH